MTPRTDSGSEREAWCRDLQQRLDSLDTRLLDLEHAEERERLDRPGHPPSADLEALRARRDAVSRRLAQCQFAEADDWPHARAEAENAWRDVSDAFDHALVRFRGRG